MKILFTVLILAKLSTSYLDFQLAIQRQKDQISYIIPIYVSGQNYGLEIHLQNVSEFILKPNKKQLFAVIQATTLEGYSFEGWKRFFKQALLWIESRYYHDIELKLSEVVVKQVQSTGDEHGVISFGSDQTQNKILQLIKDSSDSVHPHTKNIVSIYRGSNDKNVRLQIGGYQESFARGMKNGILFYELDLQASDGKWKIPVASVSCLRERNGKDDVFYIANSRLNISLNINSAVMKLPMNFASQIERNFQSVHTTCSIMKDAEQNRLICKNFSAIDLALHSIQFKINDGAFINISLYDLRRSYDESTAQTVFNIEFVEDLNTIQIGESLFKSYYVSIDMDNKKMMYSPLNHFPSSNYGVFLFRFFIGFGIFTIVSALIAMIWQRLNDPEKERKLMNQQNGIYLAEYSRPDQFSQTLED